MRSPSPHGGGFRIGGGSLRHRERDEATMVSPAAVDAYEATISSSAARSG
jgi:hypothetical protein